MTSLVCYSDVPCRPVTSCVIALFLSRVRVRGIPRCRLWNRLRGRRSPSRGRPATTPATRRRERQERPRTGRRDPVPRPVLGPGGASARSAETPRPRTLFRNRLRNRLVALVGYSSMANPLQVGSAPAENISVLSRLWGVSSRDYLLKGGEGVKVKTKDERRSEREGSPIPAPLSMPLLPYSPRYSAVYSSQFSDRQRNRVNRSQTLSVERIPGI